MGSPIATNTFVNGTTSPIISDPIYIRPLERDIRETRILKLEPGGWEDDIICQLEIVSLDEEPEFEAVSYFWGDFKKKRSITINGELHEISFNLEHALRLFRKRDIPRALWADAICIRQHDTHERSVQVSLMRDIYYQSIGVLIYLGDGLDESRGTEHIWEGGSTDQKKLESYKHWFLRFYRLPVAMRHCVEQDYEMGAYCFIYLLSEGFHLTDVPFFRSHHARENILSALDKLMRKPWWGRQWVVQETVLARKAFLFYGRFIAPWSMFTQAAANYQKHRVSCCSKIYAEFPSGAVESASRFSHTVLDLQEVKLLWERESRMELLPLLWQFRNRDTSNPKDKVYALLPLVSDWGQRQGLSPDYSFTVQQIYRLVVREMIAVTKTLTVLMGNTEKKQKNLPSWVPDWSMQCDQYEVERLHRVGLYCASGNAKPKVRYFGNCYMESYGFRFDLVAQTGKLMPKDNENESIATFQSWSHLVKVKDPDADYVAGGKRSEAYWRLLCMDTVFKRDDEDPVLGKGTYQRTDSQYGKEYEQLWLADSDDEADAANRSDAIPDLRRRVLSKNTFWQDLETSHSVVPNRIYSRRNSLLSRDTSAVVDLKIEPRSRRTSFGGTSTNNYATTVDHAIKTATANRVLFITQRGYIGLGPPSVKAGDGVYILSGGSTPFILRFAGIQRVAERIGEVPCYNLIGDCYVHGIMQGELVKDDERSQMTRIYLA